MDKDRYAGIPDTVMVDGVETPVDKEEVYLRNQSEAKAERLKQYRAGLHEGQVVLMAGKVVDCHDHGNVVVEVLGSDKSVVVSAAALAEAEDVAQGLIEGTDGDSPSPAAGSGHQA